MIESITAWREASARLGALLNTDASRAVDEARQLRGKGALKDSVLVLRGGILIDGGGQVADRQAVMEGVKAFRKLAAKHPANSTMWYNLGNGLAQLSRLHGVGGADWYVSSHPERREARRLFQDVAEQTTDVAEQAKALINLGNELDAGYRWVEAYDRWVQALRVDPSNGVAALSATRMLLRRMRHDRPHPPSLHRVAGYYARLASQNASRIEWIAGRGAMEMATKLPTFRSAWRPRKLHQIRDDLGRFVAQHWLALVGTVEGLDLRRKRWDDVHIRQISEKLSAGPGVPPVFAMFNQLKADYCAARWLAFAWEIQPPRDTSLYMDTLDYSLYGICPSLLQLAQRAAIDILDRVAVCANEYFELGLKPNETHFRSFWRESDGTGAWRAALGEELGKSNPGIIGLGELASDLGDGGMLALQRDLRNAGTHRFCVLHDMGNSPSRVSAAVDHHELGSFSDQTIATLQIVRSAILHLRDAINWRESHQQPRQGLHLPLEVLPHHYTRGEK